MNGADSQKIEIVKEIIRSSFQCGQINHTERDINPEFSFNDGRVGYHLIIARAFIDDVKLKQLKDRLDKLGLMKKLKENPNTIVRLDHSGQISVMQKSN